MGGRRGAAVLGPGGHQGPARPHLPTEFGGEGASLLELAVALEQSAGGLLPGPLLRTVLTSAVLARWAGEATRRALLPGFAAGTTGAVALAASGLRAVRAGAGGVAGGRSFDVAPRGGPGVPRPVQRYLSVPPHLIGGGTLEIQYNVVAERILGLPRG